MNFVDMWETIASNPEDHWRQEWWPLDFPSSLIVSNGQSTWDAKDATGKCPDNITSFGWNGTDTKGKVLWIGWDLDVGHGNVGYPTTEEAIQAALCIRRFFRDAAEIRLSKGGLGIHVRHLLKEPTLLCNESPFNAAGRISRNVARQLGVNADPSNMSRQAFWFWVVNPVQNAFRVIHPAAGIAAIDYAQILKRESSSRHVQSGNVETFDGLMERASRFVAQFPSAITGERNNRLNSLAYQLLEHCGGLTEDQHATLCLGWAETCFHVNEEMEVRNTIRSAWSAAYRNNVVGRKSEGDWESIIDFEKNVTPRFPTEIFPQWLKTYVEAEAEATQTPADLCGMLILSALAVVLSRKFSIQLNDSWCEPLNIFAAVALPPAHRKSAVLKDVMYLREECRRLQRENEPLDAAVCAWAEESIQSQKSDNNGDALKSLDACVEKLPEQSATIVREYYFESRNTLQIAERLGRTENAVRILLFRIRQQLRDCMESRAAVEGTRP